MLPNSSRGQGGWLLRGQGWGGCPPLLQLPRSLCGPLSVPLIPAFPGLVVLTDGSVALKSGVE